MLRVLLMAVCSCALTGVTGYFLLPVLRALKAGQSIREVGPTWHNSKAGTPMMGGLMFIFAAVLILVVNASKLDAEAAVCDVVKKYTKIYQVKSRNLTSTTLDLVIELRTAEGSKLVQETMALDGISSVSLLSHDGEVNF